MKLEPDDSTQQTYINPEAKSTSPVLFNAALQNPTSPSMNQGNYGTTNVDSPMYTFAENIEFADNIDLYNFV